MVILPRYIWKTLALTIGMALFLILGIEFIFTFANEARNIGRGDFTLWYVLWFNLLSMPQDLYQLFPMAALVGTLMGLGVLAHQSELVVMQSAGVSIRAISCIVLKLGFALALFASILGEGVAPFTDEYVQNKKAFVLSGGQSLKTEYGVWLRDNHKFINIQSVDVSGHLEGILTYELDNRLNLIRASRAAYADYVGDRWKLYDVNVSTFEGDQIKTTHYSDFDFKSDISPTLLNIVSSKHLDELSMFGLWRSLHYRKLNNLDYQPYELAFWQKIIQPFAIVVMMFLAIPFVFGPLRSATKGLKLVVGIVVGFSFHTINDLFGPLTIVYQVPPIVGACLPTLLFLVLGIYIMKRWVR